MKNFKFLFLIFALSIFSSCEMQEVGGDAQFLKFSPEITTSGFHGENLLFSTDTLQLQVHLNNIVFEKGVDYDLTYLPQEGGGRLLFENKELIAKEATLYNCTINNDVLTFQYVPSKETIVTFELLISAEGKYEELLSFTFDVKDPIFAISFLNVPDSLDINRTYEIGLKIESYAPGEEGTKNIGVFAKFAENTSGRVIFLQGNKNINIINGPAVISSSINEFNYTPSQEGLNQVIFEFSDEGVTQEAVLNVNVYKPLFSVVASTLTEEVTTSGDFKATVVIDPFNHPDNHSFDLYSTIYEEVLTKSGGKMQTLVSRTLLKENITRSSTSSAIVVEDVTLPVDKTGLLVCKVEAKSKRYGNSDDDEVRFESGKATFDISTDPHYSAPIHATYEKAQRIIFTTLHAKNAKFYMLRYNVTSGAGTVKDSKGFAIEPNSEFVFSGNYIEFTPSELGDVILEIEAVAYGEGSTVIERRDLTYVFRTDFNQLELDIVREDVAYSLGVPIEFKVTPSKEGWEPNSFSTIYSLAEGAGVLKMLSRTIEQNTTFSLNHNIQHSFSYTPSRLGVHEIVFNIEVENKRHIKQSIIFDVKVNINATVEPSYAASIDGGKQYNVNTPFDITVSNVQPGYTFLGIFVGGKRVSETLSYTGVATADLNCVAKFSRNTYLTNITINPQDGGSVAGGGSFYYNDEIKLTATANVGYIFTSLVCEDSNMSIGNNVISGNITKPINVTANFTLKEYTVNFSAGTGGKVSNIGDVYKYGDMVRSTGVPSPGYAFTGWFQGVEEVYTTATLNLEVVEAGSYEARFKVNTVQVDIRSNNINEGSVSGGGTKTIGSSVTVSASPVVSHNFTGWYDGSGTKVSSSASYTFLVPSNSVSLSAQFAIKTFKVTGSGNGASISGQGTYNYGTRVAGSASFSKGYELRYLGSSGAPTTTSGSSYTIPSLTANTHISANTTNYNRYILRDSQGVGLNSPVPYPYFVTININIYDGGGHTTVTRQVEISTQRYSVGYPEGMANNEVEYSPRRGKYIFHLGN